MLYAAMTEDAAQRSIRTFYERVIIEIDFWNPTRLGPERFAYRDMDFQAYMWYSHTY